MMIWAIFYKLNQFSIPLKPHALNFQLTLTPPPPAFPSPKVFKRNEFRVCVSFLLACVCAHVHVHARVCIISMCVCYFFLSVSV